MKGQSGARLRIVTALSLEKPVGKSERRAFLGPSGRARVRGLPRPALPREGSARGTLPPHIEVREFFMKTGDYLGNPAAQQNYISTNYTFVARDMAVQGMNVIAQAVASPWARATGGGCRCRATPTWCSRWWRSCAPPASRCSRSAWSTARCPSCPTAPRWAGVLRPGGHRPGRHHTGVLPPNNKVSAADYAIGLHASALVADGGTLQIGIGSLGDAIARR